jgi:hypothetical protein
MFKQIIFFLALFLSTSVFAIKSDYCVTCERDSRGHIKRSQEARILFKRLYPCPSTGKSYGKCPGYIIDHIVALKRGGKDEPSNMQWQTVQEAKEKDQWE